MRVSGIGVKDHSIEAAEIIVGLIFGVREQRHSGIDGDGNAPILIDRGDRTLRTRRVKFIHQKADEGHIFRIDSVWNSYLLKAPRHWILQDEPGCDPFSAEDQILRMIKIETEVLEFHPRPNLESTRTQQDFRIGVRVRRVSHMFLIPNIVSRLVDSSLDSSSCVGIAGLYLEDLRRINMGAAIARD